MSIVGWIKVRLGYAQLTSPIRAVAEKRNLQDVIVNLNYAGATAAFSQRVNLSIWVGVILASPVIIYQAWAYILPALTRREKRLSMAFVGATIPLFLIGCAFGYWILPRAWEILYGFTPKGALNITEAALYFRTVTRFILIFGVTWVMPVFLVGLIAIGVIPGRSLIRQWRPAIVAICVLSAIITPTPDPVTMFFMAGPIGGSLLRSAARDRCLDRPAPRQGRGAGGGRNSPTIRPPPSDPAARARGPRISSMPRVGLAVNRVSWPPCRQGPAAAAAATIDGNRR
jgi:sec-independent protein translocase protein TatC